MSFSSRCFSRFWLELSLPWAQPTGMAAYIQGTSLSMSTGSQWLARPTATSSTSCTTQPGTGRSTSLWEERCYVQVWNLGRQQELEIRWWEAFVRRAKDTWNKILNQFLYYMMKETSLDIPTVSDFESVAFHPISTTPAVFEAYIFNMVVKIF